MLIRECLTNTVLSGLLWAGPPRRLLDRARERSLMLCTSATLLAELAEVIARDKFVQRVQAARLSAAELVQDYERLAETVEPSRYWRRSAAIRMTIT
jgi:putative PIN family toxin of toxin-antitoxin system